MDHETKSSAVARVVEQCRVSPPPNTVPTTTLPLTFFDVHWIIGAPHVKRLFFYHCPNITTADFLTTHLPHLRQSLSLTLRSFFSMAGHLSPQQLAIEYEDGDSVLLLVAESDEDFAVLTGNEPKDANLSRLLVPSLPLMDEQNRCPVLALQFTVFPGTGLSLGITFHHAAADGNSFTRFYKSWAAIHRSGDSVTPEAPVYERESLLQLEEDKIKLVDKLKQIFRSVNADVKKLEQATAVPVGETVGATFGVARAQIDRIRDRIVSVTGTRPSTFVASLSHVWVCQTKARQQHDRAVYLGFHADCRARMDPPVPDAYFGNCIGTVFCEADGARFMGSDGLVVAAETIQAAIKRFNGRVVANELEILEKLYKLFGERTLSTIAGSPRFKVYETDFGWGRPAKTEVVSIADRQATSVAESRDGEGGLEMGMVATRDEFERFLSLFMEDFDT